MACVTLRAALGLWVAQDEIFDMIKPAHPAHIKLKDLIRAGVGHTVAHMLTDVNGFWTYDNRESLMHEDDDPGDDM